MTSKVHVVSDAKGRLLRCRLTAGQCHAAPQALPLLVGLAPPVLLADRAYDCDALVAELTARGTQVVIPPRRKRRLATRYDKLAVHFLAFIHLAATVLWLRDC